MRAVWKYTLNVYDTPTVQIPVPAGGLVVAVASQYGTPNEISVWVEVDPNEPPEPRTFHVVGTGHPVPAGAYRGTVIPAQSYGRLVWHVYEGL